MNTFKCPLCNKNFVSIQTLESHVEKHHAEQLESGISPEQYVFNMRNHKTSGTCIMHGKVSSCRKTTEFNKKTRKYNRICSNPKCKTAYVEEFKNRMINKYGREHLLNDPEVQKLMLGNRSISDTYKFSDGTSIVYTGTYELEFLQYMNLALEWPSEDLISPAPFTIYYEFEGNKLFYIPDFYIPSLDLIVEVKGTNKHYQKREEAKEKAKDNAAQKTKHNYIKIVDKDYDDFLSGLIEGIWYISKSNEKVITVNESVLLEDPAVILDMLDGSKTVLLNEEFEGQFSDG